MPEPLRSFLVDNWPSWPALWLGGLPALAWALLCLYAAGRMKRDLGVQTGYTRKVFHFAIFFSVVAIHWRSGLPGVCLFGAMTSLVIFYAVWRGSGNMLYEAMAREKDSPYRTWFILAPYFATLGGGLVSNMAWGEAAVVGYLVTGLGDAVGEPAGTRWGRHPYRVPSLGGLGTTRSLEGSAAVFAACLLGIALAVGLSGSFHFTSRSLLAIPVLALVCAAVEGVSPHGWDNATLQIIPTFLATLIL